MSRARSPRSLRARLLATLLLAVLPALLLFALGLFGLVRSSSWARFDADLIDLAQTVSDLVEYDEEGYEFALGEQPDPITQARGQVTYLHLRGPEDETLARTPALGELELPNSGPRGVVDEWLLEDGHVLRCVIIEFIPPLDEDAPPGTPVSEPITLVLARETAANASMLAQLGLWVIGLVVLTLAAAAVAAGWAVRRGLQPVQAVAAEIECIDDRMLSQRLDARSLPIEIQPIVRTTNSLLGRLEQAFVRERQLTADVAHELRTPLAVLQTSLELSLRRERSSDAYRHVLAQALADVRQLARLVGNLLELARLEGTPPHVQQSDVPLRALVEQHWTEREALAKQRGLSFTCAIPAELSVRGDPDKLGVIANNLLANAAQYTEAGGWIRVESEPERGLILAVVDSGPALSPEQREHVFERFWRADPARSDVGVHCGIGLALVRSLAELSELQVGAVVREDGSLAFELRSKPDSRSSCALQTL
jgi:signal transduction histidine kinase